MASRPLKRVLLVAAYSNIEPLGLLHLAGLARDCGYDRAIHLVANHNYASLHNFIEYYGPSIIGFNIYTGNHLQTFAAIADIRKAWPHIKIVVGGPHATYFPLACARHADWVVMSEGFKSFKDILLGVAKPGIIPFTQSMPFPAPDRQALYGRYIEFANSRIKSIIGMTGCPYRCTYCFNSSSLDDIQVTPDLIAKMAAGMNQSGRLFPLNIRQPVEIVEEAECILEHWPCTEIIYFQDDVHGFDIKQWLPDLATQWRQRIGIPYHAQMRWEMVNGDGGLRRLDLVASAGCTGLTLAIESANSHIRKEVLDRATPQEYMYAGMHNICSRALRVRTEQITGLPYGATSVETPINIDADLELVKLNIDLKPSMAWASTFAPYAGTKLGKYALNHGHYDGTENDDVPDTFFERSVLRFPQQWVGQSLDRYSDQWLTGDALERYRDQNKALRDHFNLLCLIPNGYDVAKQYLLGDDLSFEGLCKVIKHVNGHDMGGHDVYFSYLPFKQLAIQRWANYGGGSDMVSKAVRHHLYDEVLYK